MSASIWCMGLKRHHLIMFVVFAFVLRLGFGFCSEFWFDDELQIYLLGLKFFTTGHWPYFGPDVVYTHSQITGALQALLVGLPFYLYKAAQAPYIFLNILSATSLGLLSWYCVKLTKAPKWIVWGWLFFCPWAVNFSTSVINPSYVLFGAVLFFVAAFETIPSVKQDVVKERWAFFIMGFSFFWIYQLHLSWVLLLPVLCYVFLNSLKSFKRFFTNALFFILGAIPMLLLIAPTFIKFGLLGTGGTEQNIIFNFANVLKPVDVLFKTLSFASFEVPRFIGPNTAARLSFVTRNLWAAPFIIFGLIVGFAQPVSLIYEFFRKNTLNGWQFIKYFLLAIILIVYVSFFFSIKSPSAHTFYLLFPVVAVYAFYSWGRHFKKKCWRVFAAAVIFSSIVFNTAIAVDRFNSSSMLAQKQNGRGVDIVKKALETKDYQLLGKRRCETSNYTVCF
jgi:hypothetical protein